MLQVKHIINSHCHIYPEKIAHKAVTAVDLFYEERLGELSDGTAGTLLRTGMEAGITHFIVHSVATKPEQVESINRFIASAATQSEGHFTGLGALHPDASDLEGDIDSLIAMGLKGVKIHPDIQQFRADSKNAMRIFGLCEDRGIPILVHTGDYRYDYSNPNRIIPVLKAFPRLKFIGAHFGGWSIWEKAAAVLSDFPNILVDTSSSFYGLTPERAKALVRIYGSERVMFGTDYPLWPQKNELDFLERMELLPEELENVCWKTCAKLFGISFPEDGQEAAQA